MLSIKIIMKYFTIFILSSKASTYSVPTAHLSLGSPHFRWLKATRLVSTTPGGADMC